MAESPIADKARFDGIRYAQLWEDADALLLGLASPPGATLVSICSAGDNALALLTLDPARVVVVDLSPAQIACLQLRIAAMRSLDHDAFLELMGSRPSARRGPLLDRVSKAIAVTQASGAARRSARAACRSARWPFRWIAGTAPRSTTSRSSGNVQGSLPTHGASLFGIEHCQWAPREGSVPCCFQRCARSRYFQIGLPLPGRPRLGHFAVTAAMMSSLMRILRPHSRLVSGGHLLVASRPILPPSPDSGEAKSR